MKKQTRIVLALLLPILALSVGYLFGSNLRSSTFADNNTDTPPVEFTAPLNAYPDDWFGTWRIGGYSIEVTHKTKFNSPGTNGSSITPGALVHVRAHAEGDRLIADSIGILQNTPVVVELHGPVNKVQNGYWIIGGKRVRVPSAVRIHDIQEPQTGMIASVRAHLEGDILVADTISLTTRTAEAREVAFIGRLRAVNGNTWIVDNTQVTVPPDTSPPPIGTLVRVSGETLTGGAIEASDLSVQPPEIRIKGWVVAQQAPDTWEVLVENGRKATQRVAVRISPDTPMDEREGMLQTGAQVDVTAQEEAENQLRATFVRVLNARNDYVIGSLTYIPSGDRYAYPWTVDKTQVWITPNTLSDKPIAEYNVGDRVAVSGIQQRDGSIVARLISPSKR